MQLLRTDNPMLLKSLSLDIINKHIYKKRDDKSKNIHLFVAQKTSNKLFPDLPGKNQASPFFSCKILTFATFYNQAKCTTNKKP